MAVRRHTDGQTLRDVVFRLGRVAATLLKELSNMTTGVLDDVVELRRSSQIPGSFSWLGRDILIGT